MGKDEERAEVEGAMQVGGLKNAGWLGGLEKSAGMNGGGWRTREA
jgi:hypothetical protein